MNILYVAEIVGKAGVYAFKTVLPGIVKQYAVDCVIACCDGATGSRGLGKNHAAYLHKLGARVITTGDYCFFKKDLVESLEQTLYVLRPANLNPDAPGFGSRIFKIGAEKMAVVALLGQSGFDRFHSNNPFTALPALLETLRQETPYIVVDFHAQATAEKYTLFNIADGLCSAVIGSHCRVQTADEAVMPGGTARIADAGRTGSTASVGGTGKTARINFYLSGIPEWTRETWDDIELQGVLIQIDKSGKAVNIERIRRSVKAPKDMDMKNETI
ncbi:metallophosphoesterase [Spirochaetia bacterium]|nr:metallophosphoesterase [Spirochaetia bacterium]